MTNYFEDLLEKHKSQYSHFAFLFVSFAQSWNSPLIEFQKPP